MKVPYAYTLVVVVVGLFRPVYTLPHPCKRPTNNKDVTTKEMGEFRLFLKISCGLVREHLYIHS